MPMAARKSKPSGRKLKSKGNRLLRRKVNTREMRDKFLIVCEGERTEPHYFERFRVSKRVTVLGLGYNTLSLVKKAIELMQCDEYDQIWCVFDRNAFPAEDFNAAIDLARQNGIDIAYSNEAFEIWYLLHFGYHDTAISRQLYKSKLTGHLGSEYQKNRTDMYDLLKNKQPDAIRNAERLLASYGSHHNPAQDNPCTTVHNPLFEIMDFPSMLGLDCQIQAPSRRFDA
jgi:hypothetical protein